MYTAFGIAPKVDYEPKSKRGRNTLQYGNTATSRQNKPRTRNHVMIHFLQRDASNCLGVILPEI